MADLTPWTRELGTQQGRITPAVVVPPAGTKVFCLGWDLPDHFDELVIGDYAQVSQTAAFAAGARLLRVTALVRAPRVIIAGTRWIVEVLIDNVVRVRHVLVAGAPIRRRNFSINVSKLAAGSHTVTLRLRFTDLVDEVSMTTEGGVSITTEGGDYLVV